MHGFVGILPYAIKRLLAAIPLFLGVVVIVSLLLHIVPGDPIDRILGDYATLEQKEHLRQQLGLNQNIATQLWQYSKNLLQGNLGQSLIYQRPVRTLIFERLLATVELAIGAIILALIMGLSLGTISALKKNSLLDHGATLIALLGISIPNFWLGPLLILLFSLHWGILPVSERTTWQSYILPIVTLGTSLAAIISRMTRNTILDLLHHDFVRTARAKGNSALQIIVHHIIKNASLPIITIVSLQLGVLMTGAVITEKIFDWPGLGTLMLEALSNRDYPLIQGCMLTFATSYLLCNLVVDITYIFLDPQLSLDDRSNN